MGFFWWVEFSWRNERQTNGHLSWKVCSFPHRVISKVRTTQEDTVALSVDLSVNVLILQSAAFLPTCRIPASSGAPLPAQRWQCFLTYCWLGPPSSEPIHLSFQGLEEKCIRYLSLGHRQTAEVRPEDPLGKARRAAQNWLRFPLELRDINVNNKYKDDQTAWMETSASKGRVVCSCLIGVRLWI